MVTARIYAEGGGEGQLLDTLFRQAWTQFFKSAGFGGRMPRIVRGKGRLRTLDLFATAVRNPRPGEIPFLLVDSEGPVAPGSSVWKHLKARDQWEKPKGSEDDQAFLMVQIMETWFLADRVALRRFFGSSLREERIPSWPNLESVPKADVLSALERATADCERAYAKGKVSFELLGEVNPTLVEAACPHAKLLLDRLRRI